MYLAVAAQIGFRARQAEAARDQTKGIAQSKRTQADFKRCAGIFLVAERNEHIFELLRRFRHIQLQIVHPVLADDQTGRGLQFFAGAHKIEPIKLAIRRGGLFVPSVVGGDKRLIVRRILIHVVVHRSDHTVRNRLGRAAIIVGVPVDIHHIRQIAGRPNRGPLGDAGVLFQIRDKGRVFPVGAARRNGGQFRPRKAERFAALERICNFGFLRLRRGCARGAARVCFGRGARGGRLAAAARGERGEHQRREDQRKCFLHS